MKYPKLDEMNELVKDIERAERGKEEFGVHRVYSWVDSKLDGMVKNFVDEVVAVYDACIGEKRKELESMLAQNR